MEKTAECPARAHLIVEIMGKYSWTRPEREPWFSLWKKTFRTALGQTGENRVRSNGWGMRPDASRGKLHGEEKKEVKW